MNTHFKFLTLPGATGTVANVFIHGYSAGHDLDDRRLLANSIPAELRQDVNVLAFWPSSHFTEMDNRSRGLLMAAARVHPLAGAAALAGDRAMHFARIRSRAEAMGETLLEQLGRYLREQHREVMRINLIGHSLGGRLLVSMLRQLARAGVQARTIGDVLLMGAAVRVEADEALRLRGCIGGRLINAWSSEDPVLLLNLGERSMGRMPVEHLDNVRMQGYRHNHYWKHLRDVLAATRFNGFCGQPDDALQAAASEQDPVLQDTYLHTVLQRSPAWLLDEAVKHLRSSRWTRLKDGEADLTYAFVREFQLVGGHFLVNAARRHGVAYTRVLGMLARQYGLAEELHHCATVVEVETLLLRTFFRHAFGQAHPLALAPLDEIRAMPGAVYARHIDALAERLTLAASLRSTAVAPIAGSGLPAALKGLLGSLRQTPLDTLLARFGSALRPGYSALIPSVAIIFYARITLDDESLM